jgi:hypothetical protein
MYVNRVLIQAVQSCFMHQLPVTSAQQGIDKNSLMSS